MPVICRRCGIRFADYPHHASLCRECRAHRTIDPNDQETTR